MTGSLHKRRSLAARKQNRRTRFLKIAARRRSVRQKQHARS